MLTNLLEMSLPELGYAVENCVFCQRTALFSLFKCFEGFVSSGCCRYAVEEGVKVEDFQDFLVHEVLLKILCYDYMGLQVEWPRNKVRHMTHQSHPVSKADKDGVNQQLDSTLPVTVAPSRGSEYEGREKLTSSTHDRSLLEVGSTIVDIIIALSSYENQVLDTFWPEFHTLCLNIIEESGSVAARNDQRVHRIARFFHLLCEKKSVAGVRRKNWLLQDAVQPFVARTFSVIKSTVSLLTFFVSLQCWVQTADL